MAITWSPFSLIVTDFGGLSSARRSSTKNLPFSVPAYSAAPSAENERHVSGAGIWTMRNKLRGRQYGRGSWHFT